MIYIYVPNIEYEIWYIYMFLILSMKYDIYICVPNIEYEIWYIYVFLILSMKYEICVPNIE